MSYIKREAAINDLENCRKEYSAIGNVDGACAMVIAKNVLSKQPTADVEEVRHGEWQIVDSDIGYVELECSLCRNKLLFNTDDGFTYCPNCGAKMDGGRRAENGKS